MTDGPLKPPGLCLVASTSPAATGGLAAYARHLARHLASDFSVASVARFGTNGPPKVDHAARQPPQTFMVDKVPVRIVAPSDRSIPLLKLTQPLMHRPHLQRLATAVFAASYVSPLARAISPQVRIVHYIGVGWEMLGFPALEVARRRSAAFTVWPAIHVSTWGDSELDARLYRAADAVFAQSHHERRLLVELGVEPSRIVVTRLAPAVDATGNGPRFRARHGIGERPLVLFVGRKQSYKGYHALCEAMPRLLERFPDCVLVLVGSGAEAPSRVVPPRALLDLGACDEREKADAFAACDIFCMPSEAEAFGMVFAEAWSYGKPVVGGIAPAVRELIREGVDGFCVPQEPERVSEVLERLLAHPELRRRLGSAGLARQRRELTWEAVAETHKQTFWAVLARSAIATSAIVGRSTGA